MQLCNRVLYLVSAELKPCSASHTQRSIFSITAVLRKFIPLPSFHHRYILGIYS